MTIAIVEGEVKGKSTMLPKKKAKKQLPKSFKMTERDCKQRKSLKRAKKFGRLRRLS